MGRLKIDTNKPAFSLRVLYYNSILDIPEATTQKCSFTTGWLLLKPADTQYNNKDSQNYQWLTLTLSSTLCCLLGSKHN